MPVAPDKVYSLPNDVPGFILSKVTIREAARCSVLSKRWRFLLQGFVTPNPLSISMAENAISSILQSHSLDLEAFHLFNDTTGTRTYPVDHKWEFSRESIWKWVQNAADKNVRQLILGYSKENEIPPPALFVCTHITTLTLFNHIRTHIPTHSSGPTHLINCTLEDTVDR